MEWKELSELNHFSVTWKINIWMPFVFIFVQHFVDFFIPKAIERRNEVRVNQREIIFQCIVSVFSVSSVFYSQCQIDQTSAVWLKHFSKKSHIVKLRLLSCSVTTTVFSDCTRLAAEAVWVAALRPCLNSLSKFTGSLLFSLFLKNNTEEEWVQILNSVFSVLGLAASSACREKCRGDVERTSLYDGSGLLKGDTHTQNNRKVNCVQWNADFRYVSKTWFHWFCSEFTSSCGSLSMVVSFLIF